jgi:transposase
MSQGTTQWVGIDLHQENLVLSVFAGDAKEASLERVVPTQSPALRPVLTRLGRRGPVRAVYEAGGCGYWLARRLRGWGLACEVAAPSLIPRQAGARVKTDRRDARKLATLHRAGLLECVHVPTEAEERLRGLVRARDAARRDLNRSRQRVLKLLQARGLSYEGSKHWSQRHWKWLCGLRLEGEDQVVLSHQLTEIELRMAMRAGLDERVAARSLEEPYAGPVARLRCLRGIDTLSAMTLATEVFDMRRFRSARRFMGWLGLGVSENSSGARRRQGGITRAGNGRCRRILVEAAWNNIHRPYIGRELARRQQGQAKDVVAHAWRAQRRLHDRWTRLAPKKDRRTAITAMARQLSGYVWALWLAEPEHLHAHP